MAKPVGSFQSGRSLEAGEEGREKGVHGQECMPGGQRQLQATPLFTTMLQEKGEEEEGGTR